jgi:hypothetical protein
MNHSGDEIMLLVRRGCPKFCVSVFPRNYKENAWQDKTSGHLTTSRLTSG